MSNEVTYQDAFVQGVRLLQQCDECELCAEHQHVSAGERAFWSRPPVDPGPLRDSSWIYRTLAQAYAAETGKPLPINGTIHLKPTDIAHSELEQSLRFIEINYIEFTTGN